MPGTISRSDVSDVDFVDAEELLSDGNDIYKSSVTVVSVVSATKTVTVSGGLEYDDFQVRPDDVVDIESNVAAGTYTVDSVVSDTQFTVKESIVDATGGTADFKYRAGALSVGVDSSNMVFSSSSNLQSVLEDLDYGLSSGHETLRHLIHFIDDGPAGGFASGAYKETLPAADPFPSSVIWWESSSKLKKIVELSITRNSNKLPTSEVWKMYESDGTTVKTTVTDSISYSGVFETYRTRTIA